MMATAGEGINIALGTLGCAWVGKVLIAWINAKFGQKAKVEGSVETQVKPNPLNVVAEPKPRYVTCEECKERHRKVDERFAAGNESFKAIRNEIAGMRKDVNAGIARINERINDRISPVAEACAANSAAIQIMLKESKP
ncbi:MAG: hypothetical protein IKO01_07045 [Kiritimatiellae bacterium]|nr:hypothetical protein [Kiritimatiellia bacterium]